MTPRKKFFDHAVIAAIILAGLTLVLALLDDATRESLQWTRSGVQQGEWWRLVTAHVIHLDFSHTLLNASVLILLAALFGSAFTLARHGLNAIIGMLFIDAGLLWLGHLEWYVGLSGLLHALAAAAIVRLIIDHHDQLAWGVAIFGLAKIVYENTMGAMPFSSRETFVVTDVHLFGVLIGMALGLIPSRHRSTLRLNDLA
jgi:rhomboid family GlyGly-CTERM serine protease